MKVHTDSSGVVVMIREQHSRAGSDSSIEHAVIEDSPDMKSSPISSVPPELSEEDGLLTPLMPPTTSDNGTTSGDGNLRVADDAMASVKLVNQLVTDKNPSPTSSDRTTPETWTQSPMQSPNFDPCDIIKVIPRPEFPIRVFEGAPPPFSQEAQNRSIRWTRERECYHFAPNPDWLSDPDEHCISYTLGPHLNRLGYDSDSAEIEFLSEGGFHKVYTITAPSLATKQLKSFVLRIPLPVDPYFKTESDVATTEMVRYTTQVPVPIIYAYDSSSDNDLGYEWILMEKINGKPMFDHWENMDYDSKLGFTKLIAGWNTQLAKIVSTKIGAIYMHYTTTALKFYVGRCVDSIFTQDNRLSYDVYRGPFKTSFDFFASVLAVTAKDVNDLRLKNRAGRMRDARYRFLDRIWIKGKPIDDEEIKEWQDKREKDVEILTSAIKALQERLPALCERLFGVGYSTRLSHHDLSLSNVLVDENRMPITLLDWEFSELRPLMFLADIPRFLQGSAWSSSAPQRYVIPPEGRLRSSAKVIAECEAQNEVIYLEMLETFTRQRLRSEYHAELQRLGSPLQGANWEYLGVQVLELYNYVMFIWHDTKDIIGWVETQFKSDFEKESEADEEENEPDEDEHEDEKGEVKAYDGGEDNDKEGEVGDMVEVVGVEEETEERDMIKNQDGEGAVAKAGESQ